MNQNSNISNYPIALSIAGSDPSGGAGIQMDLKTFESTGVWGMAAITALTAQNAGRVSGVWAMDPAIVKEQIQTLLEDMIPDAVKTGMLATTGNIQAIIDALPEEISLVVDPVMISTSGHHLLDSDALKIIRESLIPLSMVVTPNIPEAEALTGISIENEDEMIRAGYIILDLGCQAVVMKGGHGSGKESVDILITQRGIQKYSALRMPYPVHGSGCCFSAAITGYLARGERIEVACEKGKTVVSKAIKNAIPGKSGMKMVNPSYQKI